MCGINGIIEFNPSAGLETAVDEMNNKIIHRGPDDQGVFSETRDAYSISMGMRRLSIIDLNNGKQPIFSADKSTVIVFNGEIYNYLKLRSKLIERGVEFSTNSDTEVVLYMYLEYGEDSFSELDGMFAFSIFDKVKEKVFIARDYFGEKPLYYCSNVKGIVWGSELKSLVSRFENKPQISSDGLELFFSLTYIPAPFTIYQGVYKLESNHYMEIDLKTETSNINHISHDKIKYSSEETSNFDIAKNKVKHMVEQSVVSRSVADVPIGTFLSGGVDSSIVSHCLAKYSESRINTFSIGFDEKSFDETEKARVVAKKINSNHHEYIIKPQSIRDYIDQIILNFDEPFADSSALPTFLVAKKTSQQVKVALTGDGGDEIFGGYNKYHISRINSSYVNYIPEILHNNIFKPVSNLLFKNRTDERGFSFKVKKTMNSLDYSDNFYWNIISLGFKVHEQENLILDHEPKNFSYYKKDKGLNKTESLSDLRMIDKHLSLEGDMLVKVDRTSMLTSLECRAPFLNKDLWIYSHSLPDEFLIRKGSKKHILKEAFKKEFPENFLEKPKQGFGIPIGNWLRGPLKEELESYTEETFVKEQGLFNHKFVKKLIGSHLSKKEDNTFKVWTYFCFQKWFRHIYSDTF